MTRLVSIAASLLFLLGLASDVEARQLRTSFKAHVDSFATLSGPRLIFLEQDVKASVQLTGAKVPSVAVGPLAMALPEPGWPEGLIWEFRDRNTGQRLGGRAVPVSTSPSETATELRAGDTLKARFRLIELEQGDYVVRARLGEWWSEPASFRAVRGDESAEMRKEFARYRVLYQSSGAEALEENLRELAAADPLNAGPWIRLADIAIGRLPLGTTLERYSKAEEVLEKRRLHFLDREQPDVVAAIESESEVLRRVREVLPRVYASNGELILIVHEGPSKRYLLKKRRDGEVMEVIRASRRE